MTTAERIQINPERKGRERIEVIRKAGRRTRKEGIVSARDKTRLLLGIFAIGLFLAGMVVVSAYSASINYSNNLLKDRNTALSGEVESLRIEIESANSVANIEKKAIDRLGMVYAEGEQYVQVTKGNKAGADFAMLLKTKAYN